ncbi:MAG: ATP-binding protein [Halioglobus sp.]
MSFWQPRSVLQLLLVSFFAALAPLCVAIMFTVQTLGELADKNREVTSLVVEVTRLGQEIQRDVLELERRARQYLALSDPEFAQLFARERKIVLEKLALLQDRMPSDGPDLEGLLNSLAKLTLSNQQPDTTQAQSEVLSPEARLDQAFAVISGQNAAVKQWLLHSVDQLLQKNALETDQQIDSIVWQLSLLAFATLALLLICAYWINKPVRDLTQAIHELGTSGLGREISISGPQEVQDLGSKLDWLRQSLHESEQQKQQFLRHISHELKTPLSSLREGADLLAEQIPGHLSHQQREVVEIVRQNGIELQRLIENLLDYNQLPQQEMKFEDVDIGTLLGELLSSYRITIEKKSLQVKLSGKVTNWVADRHKLKTSLDNLLSNAINYSPAGGNIDIVWRKSSDDLIIDVANSGRPIPPEDAERVFEPFFQSTTQRTGPLKGSGIGLSVARECIEAQGGTLTHISHSTLPICFRLLCPAH